MKHFLFMILPLCHALSQDLESKLVLSFMYCSYGILVVIIVLSLVFYDRKGIFLGLVYWFTFMQFIILVTKDQSFSGNLDLYKELKSFFKPANLIDDSSTNFLSNCLLEAILIIAIFLILAARKFIPSVKRNLVDLATLITYLTIQDFVFYSILNLISFSTDGIINYSGVALSILYLLGLVVFIGLLTYTLKSNKEMSNFIREDYENSEYYYFVLIFELIITAVFCAVITDQYLLKIILIASIQAGVSNY